MYNMGRRKGSDGHVTSLVVAISFSDSFDLLILFTAKNVFTNSVL